MERNVMGELNVYRGSGAKPNFSEIARRRGMDRHTVAKYWREGEAAVDGRSARGSAFDPLEEEIRAKAQLPGMTKMAVYAFLREGRGEGLPGYGAFTAWCRARDVPFGGGGGREPHPRFETPPGRQLQFDWKEGMRLVDSEGEVFEFSVFTATLDVEPLLAPVRPELPAVRASELLRRAEGAGYVRVVDERADAPAVGGPVRCPVQQGSRTPPGASSAPGSSPSSIPTA